MPIHRTVVDAGIAGEFAQADRFTPSASSRSSAAFTSASGKFPWRKVSRFGGDFPAMAQSPTDFAAIYQPLTAKRSFPYMSPLETLDTF